MSETGSGIGLVGVRMCVSVMKKEKQEEGICNFKSFLYTAFVDIKAP